MTLTTLSQDELEKKLVIDVLQARAEKDRLESEFENAKAKVEEAENELLELLDVRGQKSTARYAELGYMTAARPRIYASIIDEDALFADLRKIERDDLIKEAVNTQSLGTLLKERLENFQELPAGSDFRLKRTVIYYPDKKK
jgi:uncharacterized protein (UPF0297 family)